MKTKLILTLTAALTLGLLAACGGDDDDSGKNNDNQGECTSNADCADRTDGKTECDAAAKACVAPAVDEPECTSDADCADRTDGKTECDAAAKACVAPAVDEPECTSNADCADRTDGKTECDAAAKACVAPAVDEPECTSDADCADRTDGKTECDAAAKACVAPAVDEPECTSDADCADRTDGKTECDAAAKACVAPTVDESDELKISQVYLAGYPNIGSKYDASYVELFNAGTSQINLKEYSVVYGKTAVTDVVSLYSLCANDNCIVPAGGYFLIKVKAASADEMTAIEAEINLDGNPNMGIDGVLAIGKVSGLSNGEADCDVVKAHTSDLIGMGANAWCHEGSGNASGVDRENRSDQAYFRKGNGCTDTDDNAADYEVSEASFRNSQTTPAPCAE